MYQHLRKELKNQNIKPGSFVTINQLSKQLGIYRTPLQDALLQLQAEGFVTFLPQLGIQFNELTRKDLEAIYEILGALDSRAMFTVFCRLTPDHIEKMKQIKEQMYACVPQEEYNRYFDLNTAFHNVYLELSTNKMLLSQVNIYCQRAKYLFYPRINV